VIRDRVWGLHNRLGTPGGPFHLLLDVPLDKLAAHDATWVHGTAATRAHHGDANSQH
jgi:hypothetical protein